MVHERAWKEMFDEFLGDRGTVRATSDYDDYVDGKPREDGIRDFLAVARHRARPTTRSRRSASARTTLVLKLIHDEGVEAYGARVAT